MTKRRLVRNGRVSRSPGESRGGYCNVYLLCEQFRPEVTHWCEELTYDLEKGSSSLNESRLSTSGIQGYRSTKQVHLSSTEVTRSKCDIIIFLCLISGRCTYLSIQVSNCWSAYCVRLFATEQ